MPGSIPTLRALRVAEETRAAVPLPSQMTTASSLSSGSLRSRAARGKSGTKMQAINGRHGKRGAPHPNPLPPGEGDVSKTAAPKNPLSPRRGGRAGGGGVAHNPPSLPPPRPRPRILRQRQPGGAAGERARGGGAAAPDPARGVRRDDRLGRDAADPVGREQEQRGVMRAGGAL